MKTEKAREQAVRRKLRKIDEYYRLRKSSTYPSNGGYQVGGYHIIDGSLNTIIDGSHPTPFSMSLEDVESWVES